MTKGLLAADSECSVLPMSRRIASAAVAVVITGLLAGFAPAANAAGVASGGTNITVAKAAGHKMTGKTVVAKKAARSNNNSRAAAYEAAIVKQTNAYRLRKGCKALKVDKHLKLAARRHSDLMVKRGELSHRLKGEAKLSTRIVKAGYKPWRVVAENLAMGFETPRANMDAWIASPGHKANLDDCRLRHIGVSVRFGGGSASLLARLPSPASLGALCACCAVRRLFMWPSHTCFSFSRARSRSAASRRARASSSSRAPNKSVRAPANCRK